MYGYKFILYFILTQLTIIKNIYLNVYKINMKINIAKNQPKHNEHCLEMLTF